MAKRRIFTVGFQLPRPEFEQVPFTSDQTLLDADITLFLPSLRGSSYETYNGKRLLTETDSFQVHERLLHWNSEITTAINAGKLVIVYVVKPVECFRYTGEKTFSGTGRNRGTTNIVVDISSYAAVPQVTSVTTTSGEVIRLDPEARFFKPYWDLVGAGSRYETTLEGRFTKVLLRSASGDRVVGAAVTTKAGGALLLLPPLPRTVEEEGRAASKRPARSPSAQEFVKRLAGTLYAMLDSLQKGQQTAPPPEWTAESKYRLERERELEKLISNTSQTIAEAQVEKERLEGELRQAGGLRRLLYEQGRPLEYAILEALQTLGFEAKPFKANGSEFDSLFVCTDGRRCLGEAEGKDTKAVNIDKLSQLERNLQEDFAREGVTEYAKGVLFGNAHRTIPLAARKEFFTEKCIAGARRAQVALVRTPDLFGPAKHLMENPGDLEYAARCRQAIFAANGEIVKFPDPPTSTAVLIDARATQAESL